MSNKIQSVDASDLISSDTPLLEFKIIREELKEYPKFRKSEYKTIFVIKHNIGVFTNLVSIRNELERNFESIINKALRKSKPGDRIGLTIDNEFLDHPIYVAYQSANSFDVSKLYQAIEKVAQSHRSFLTNGLLTIEVSIIENLSGSGVKGAPKLLSDISKRKHSTVNIKNDDNSCGYRAKYHMDNKSNLIQTEWEVIRDHRCQKQKVGAQEIANGAGLDLTIPVNSDVWQIIQNSLLDYQIKVIDATYKSNLIFCGPDKEKKLYIEYLNNHYNAITNIRAYMGKKYFCEKCFIGFHNLFDHCCPDFCKSCYSNCSSNDKTKILCDDCKREFIGNNCYDRHLKTKICKYIKKCNDCEVTYKIKSKHNCKEMRCKKCSKIYKNQPHYCYINSKDLNKLQNEDAINKIIVAYDIESTLYLNEHRPNLLAQQTICDKCIEFLYPECCICSTNMADYIFGNDCVRKFVDYLFETLAKKAQESNSMIYAFALNARGYDAQFILRELWNRGYDDIKLIMRGRHILLIDCGNVKMMDSLNFFLQPLEKLPKALGLQMEIKKGDFPHAFNIPEHYDYEGPIPSLEYFKLDQHKPEKAKKIHEWYAKQLTRNDWNFRNELISYCQNDVEILMQCIMKFREEFKNITTLDPITRCFTLASIGMEVFKSKFLPGKKLAITPIGGYTKNRNHSKVAETWLDWIQKSNKITLKREYKIGPYYCDGFDIANNTVYEFFGCYWHGCYCTFKKERDEKSIGNSKNGFHSPNEKFQGVSDKIEFYKNKGYQVKYIWECEFRNMKKQSNSEMKLYTYERYHQYSAIENVGHIKIKDSFFGGRTNNIQFYKSAEIDEEIKYLDFCSLYPFVLKKKFIQLNIQH